MIATFYAYFLRKKQLTFNTNFNMRFPVAEDLIKIIAEFDPFNRNFNMSETPGIEPMSQEEYIELLCEGPDWEYVASDQNRRNITRGLQQGLPIYAGDFFPIFNDKKKIMGLCHDVASTLALDYHMTERARLGQAWPRSVPRGAHWPHAPND